MAHTKAMGIGAMLVLLVAAVVILPMIVRYLTRLEPHFVVSGFKDVAASEGKNEQHSERADSAQVSSAPHVPPMGQTSYHPDQNTNFLCGSPNGSGQSCPEGTFCDGMTQACVPNFVGGDAPEIGYFS